MMERMTYIDILLLLEENKNHWVTEVKIKDEAGNR